MYVKHEQLKNTEGNNRLWKYMSLSKFLNLLNGKLYFNRVDCFEDVFESTYPEYNTIHRGELYDDINEEEIKHVFDLLMIKSRLHTYVSCFHKNDYESAFMWKQYAGDDGVAILTTVDRLKECFHNELREIYICDVDYIDYEREFMPEGNIFYLSLHKRKSFVYENEVRCLFSDNFNKPLYNGEKGLLMEVDLQKLIDKVYISPYAPTYMKADIERILCNYGINAEVIYSPLYTIK